MSKQLGRSKTDADYGMGEAEIDVSELGMMSEEELTGKLVSAFKSPGYKPPRLPTVATELLALSQNPDVDFKEIEKLLEQDAVLAGEILSIARSAFYSRNHTVGSMRSALVLLGLRQLNQVVMQAAMTMRVFRCDAYVEAMDRLRLHCRATAHVAAIVSNYTPIPEEHAFICGLLHDVGIAGILLVLGDVPRGQEPPPLEGLWASIHEAHSVAGARMAELWGLPADFTMTIGAHHQVLIEGFEHPLSAAICLAESITSELGLALIPPEGSPDAKLLARTGIIAHGMVDGSSPVTLDKATSALGLNEQKLGAIREDAKKWASSEQTVEA